MSDSEHPFDRYVRQPPPRIRLAEAALLFAADEYPHLRPDIYLALLDQLADRVSALPARTPHEQVEALRRVIVQQERIQGSRDNYYNPENSYLHRVIERRRGIPITLSAIWLDVSSALGFPIVGIGAPGHFLVRHTRMEEGVFVDPFQGGMEVSAEAVRRMLESVAPPNGALSESALAPVDTAYILRRMLGNLYSCYLERNDLPRTARVLRRMIAVVPREIPLQIELARVLSLSGSFEEAADVAQRAGHWAADDEERRLAKEALRFARARAAELN